MARPTSKWTKISTTLDWWFYLTLIGAFGNGALYALTALEPVRDAAAAGCVSFLGAAGAVQAWKIVLGIQGHLEVDHTRGKPAPPSVSSAALLLAAGVILVGFGVKLAG